MLYKKKNALDRSILWLSDRKFLRSGDGLQKLESSFVADYTTLHFSLALPRRYYHNPDFIDPKNCFAIEYGT